ncbi:MAG: hypothetical protein ACREOC_15390 [Gemmatimonadales bacterium]
MRKLLPLGALLALTLAGCSTDTVTGPDTLQPSFACSGNSGNCGGGPGGGGGNHNNNPNNPPATTP